MRVLCVCTGNVCRSPVAERLLGQAFGPDVMVTSAGTRALVGSPIAEPMARRLREDGVAAESFAARWLKPPLVRDTDVLIAMTRAHRGDAVELWPRIVRRSFTLLELARLSALVDSASITGTGAGQRLTELVDEAQKLRRPADPPEADDVVDPYGLAEADYSASYAVIADAVRQIADRIRLRT